MKKNKKYELWSLEENFGLQFDDFETLVEEASEIHFQTNFVAKYFLVIDTKSKKLLKSLSFEKGKLDWTNHR